MLHAAGCFSTFITLHSLLAPLLTVACFFIQLNSTGRELHFFLLHLPFSGCVSPFVLLCILSQEKHSLLLPRIHGPRDVLQQACSPPSNQQVAAGLPNSSWTKPMLLVFAAAVKLSSPCVPPTSPGYVLLCWSGLLCLPWM
ncbi:hypothetical protein LR48_Vigan09g083300 [Vigna angularis]|uniref:Uncharacterized protein n=1 Tax=Phaseolus angularis TaxID=3914 RepID=A0A0L9VBY9_PHAAN|nr:hypothetical protein LR48_Vigan09g083300 [Vigna angularis]